MCIRVGNTEFSTVKALMTMSLNAILADVFGIDVDAVELSAHLRDDLRMDDAQQAELAAQIADYFDGLAIDFAVVTTVDDLFNRVIEQEFQDIPAEAF